MPMTLLGPTRDGEEDESFACYGFGGGLNIKSLPQELDDGDLTIAYNVNLRSDGGVQQRKGMNPRGAVLGSGVGQNVARFFQTIVNGVPTSLTNPTKFLLAQIGDTLWDWDRRVQIGSNAQLAGGASGSLPWSAVRAYDADHLLSAPVAAPTLAAFSGGSLAAGTYKFVYTYLNPIGETVVSPESSITISGSSSQDSIEVLSPPSLGNANTFRVYMTAVNGASGTETLQTITGIGSPVFINSAVVGVAPPATNTALAPSDVFIICTGIGGPYIFDGTNLYTPASYSSIAGARWCSILNGIVWFGGIPTQSNLAVATLVGNHVETLQSFFSLSSSVSGLAPLGAGALGGMTVGHTLGLSVIYGTGSSNFFQNDFIHTDYPDAGRTMVAVNGMIFFLGSTAMWVFDGTNITRISDKVEPWILNDPLYPDFPMNGNRTLSFMWFYNNRLHFAYDSGNLGYCTAYLVFDMIVQGWTLYFGPKLAGACLLDAPGDTDPHACCTIDATTGQVYNWDVYNGLGTNGHGVTDNGNPIVAIFNTKYFKIEEPGCKKKLVRIYPELFVESFTGQVVVTTDYGMSTYSQPAALVTTQMEWDVSNWDQANWASASPVFFQPRLEVGNATPLSATTLEFEAVAFGIQNNPSDPPFTWAGVSGDLIYEPRA